MENLVGLYRACYKLFYSRQLFITAAFPRSAPMGIRSHVWGSAAIGLAAMTAASGLAEDKAPSRTTPIADEAPVGADHQCVYPSPRIGAAAQATTRAAAFMELEPNNTLATANLIPLSTNEPAVDVTGALTSDDIDYFRFELEEGDLLNAAIVEPTAPDTVMALVTEDGLVEVVNDDESGQSGAYPASSPLLRTFGLNPTMTYFAPTSGVYYLGVRGYSKVQTGAYTLQVRIYEGGVATLAPGEKQIIFVDFDGATIDAQSIFGFGNAIAELSPMSEFLTLWGLADTEANRDLVLDGVMAKIEQNFEEVRSIQPNFGYELRNSRDHADPWGQPNVSRIIVGGTQDQLGIGTIGIAESIDPGNYERRETGVVLLDLMSDPAQPLAFVNQQRGDGIPILEAVSRGIGNLASHEAGHYLGCWHTFNANETPCLIDSGGGLYEENLYDAGPDWIIGTADDVESSFTRDEYARGEFIGVLDSLENTDYRVAYGLAVPESCSIEIDFEETPALWPPSHAFEFVDIESVVHATDSLGHEVTLRILGVSQDEPINAVGDGNTSCDAELVSDTIARVRRERAGTGDGRVYLIAFEAICEADGSATPGVFEVHVPFAAHQEAVNGGALFDSLTCLPRADANADRVVDALDLILVLATWGQSGPDATLNWPDGDINADNVVDAHDLASVLTFWGAVGD
jgi:hypothetical protein